jgi:flagellar assembly protein FliH
MSSRIILPGDEREIGRVPWRLVGAAPAPVLPPEKSVPPDMAEQLAQLEAQYQQKVREAHAAGIREGEIAGRNRAGAELQPVLERLARSIQEITNLRARLRREAESDVVQLALAIARRVVRREIVADPDALRGLVVAALEKLHGQEISRVKVHPSHSAMVKASLQQVLSGGLVEVLSDSSRELGSVVFETARGNLDASVDTQLQEIERGLTDRLRKQP